VRYTKRAFRNGIFWLISLFFCSNCNNERPVYLDSRLSVDQRVDDLISRMTIEEKISQLSHFAPGIPHLGVIPYNPIFKNPLGPTSVGEEIIPTSQNEYEENEYWKHIGSSGEAQYMDGGYWNEALHGVARAGRATSFPQCIGLGATWNPELIEQMAQVIGIEARIHHNEYGKKLTYWSPNINILRDPRWGRNEESYAEDPYLLSKMAVAYVKGLQGYDDNYLQAVATVKHFVANNSEFNRHSGSSDIEERFLREYYLPAFKAAVTEGKVQSVMSAYNAVNGVPASVNKWLLDSILRQEWGFAGYVVSDCGAISDIPNVHKYETNKPKAVAMAVVAGTDLECETCEIEEFMFDNYLKRGFDAGYVQESHLNKAIKRLFRVRIKLGEFEQPGSVPFDTISLDMLESPAHQELALEVARQSMVLLKNEDNILPLSTSIKRLAVIGPNADVVALGGYAGDPSIRISSLNGLSKMLGDETQLFYHKGCNIISNKRGEEELEDENWIKNEDVSIAKAAQVASNADVAIVVVGTNLSIANEGGDRVDLDLPGRQLELIQKVHRANPKTIVVLINAMPLTINWVNDNIPAIIEAWYPGQSGGLALAEVLFGKINPGGKLPITFYKSIEDLPPLGDYDITKGRTYWFYEGEVLYPFGYGLSYTLFDYSNLQISNSSPSNNDIITISFDIANIGSLGGDEVIQLYIRDIESTNMQPLKRLKRFKRQHINADESIKITFELNPNDFKYWNPDLESWHLQLGQFEIQIGSSSADIRLSQTIAWQ
jgi:beta-glucosidase